MLVRERIGGPQKSKAEALNMLWMFLSAGLIGILCGSLYRAPALIILSFIGLFWMFILLLVSGLPSGEAFIAAFLATAVLQLGYLLGAGFGNLLHQLRLRTAVNWRSGFRILAISPRSRRWLIPNG